MLRDLARHLAWTGNTARYAVERPRLAAALDHTIGIETLLDAGAGGGEYVQTIYTRRCRRVFALEPEDRHVDLLRRRLAGNPSVAGVLRGSVLDVPFAAGFFDAVACSQVLEHVADDAQAVREFARVLRPGGYLLLTVPLPPVPWPEPDHVRDGYTLEALSALVAAAGFERVACDYFLTRETQRVIRIAHRFFRGYAPRVWPLAELRLSADERRSHQPYGLLALFRKPIGAQPAGVEKL